MRKTICSVIITFTLLSFGLAQKARAVSPPPDGGYPGGNTAGGQNALLSLTSGMYNTAVGFDSLLSFTTGNFNTAIGAGALLANTGGPNGAGSQNTATGAGALLSNTTGVNNTANGVFALFSNTDGSDNTAVGQRALFSNIGATEDEGVFNTGIGSSALSRNTTGSGNTAVGGVALFSNITGSSNTAIGTDAGYAITGDRNICIGAGVPGVAGENNTIRIGDVQTSTYIAGIYAQFPDPTSAVNVQIDNAGRLGTGPVSSRRFKRDIQPMNEASEAILTLRPVTFRYRKDIDAAGKPQFGLVAEDVESVNPDLVVRDKEGKPYSVRYDQVNAMLLNEFLKEHRKVEQLTKDFESKLAAQQKQIEALTAGLQRVSEQVEKSKVAPKVVSNP